MKILGSLNGFHRTVASLAMAGMLAFGAQGAKYFVAVAAEAYTDGAACMPDCYAAWMGSTIAPFGTDRLAPGDGLGFMASYTPLIGDPSSMVQATATLCPDAFASPPPRVAEC